ncbi:MAG: hypothetical protein M3177_07435 [Pseudomonadota bacterium]|nr:hypothetical protein [Pseudomonadota bacterium]
MRRTLLFTAPLLLLASPALATGGFRCEARDGSNLAISGTIGRVIGNPLGGASLHVGEQTISTTDAEPQIAIGRSWIDEREIRVDLIDANAQRFEAQLRARPTRNGTATGTLIRHGRTHRVRCELE